MCDEQHIADNEVLTQILDLQCHLVKYGYYDNQKNVDDVCCQVKVKAREGSGDINYPVPVLGITPRDYKVFIQLDRQTEG